MEVLDLCLECKACKSECPMSVDMATLKSEVLYQRHRQRGTPIGARVFGHARAVNRAGSAVSVLANAAASRVGVRAVMERVTGIDRRRPLPAFARQSLGAWFRRRPEREGRASRGNVVFFADSFTSYSEPEIGRAAIDLLELAGWRVQLVDDVCCGRSLISKGLLDQARARHRALLERLAPFAEAGTPIVGIEPSCLFTLRDELVSLSGDDERAQAIACQAQLVEQLLADAVEDGAIPLSGARRPVPILFHAHCHQKAASAVAPTSRLLEQIPGAQVTVLDSGCCGMAGSFGYEREHYDLSMQIGEMRLFPAVRASPDGGLIAATGVSCRQQIAHGTGRKADHPVVLLHRALVGP